MSAEGSSALKDTAFVDCGLALVRRILIHPVELLFFLWELPQNLLGLLLAGLLRMLGRLRGVERSGRCLYLDTRAVSVSLGRFLFCRHGAARIRQHEYGHSVQSRILGPLYLPVVGLPSVVRNLYGRLYRRRTGHPWLRYYDGFPERWADRLGGLR